MSLRNLAVVILSIVAVTTLIIASTVPGFDIIRLIRIAAIAIVVTDLLSRGGNPP